MVDWSTEDADEAVRVARRAVRRLGVLSVALFVAAGLLAVGAGFLTAWALSELVGAPLRLTWILASLLFFLAPAAGVLAQERLRIRGRAEPGDDGREPRRDGNDGR